MEFDSVLISVEDLDEAERAYELLLGCTPTRHSGRTRFQLPRGAIELRSGKTGTAALRFIDAATVEARVETFHGLAVHIDPPPPTRAIPTSGPDGVLAIDHAVIRTTAPERAIELWRDHLGVRLAFDKEFPDRGMRLLFFRSAGMTLEYAAPFPAAPSEGDDQFYGLSYRVPSIGRTQERLRGAGVEVSEQRRGHRPDSFVATVRSGTCGIPTLLIERHEAGSATSTR